MNLIPVILAGGAGSRLWPLSRAEHPKPFHPLLGGDTLLQATARRAARLTDQPPIVLCQEAHRFLVAEQLRQAGCGWNRIILEPALRSTAPAIALAALAVRADRDDALLLVLPSDHWIDDDAAFADACRQGAAAAAERALVLFGIQPTRAETGYGYVKLAPRPVATAGQAADALRARPVLEFVEKPDQARAERLLADGNYLWNSGMFLFSASVYLNELAQLAPAMLDAARRAFAEGERDLDFFRPGSAYLDSPADSVDYAVMEKTRRAAVVPARFGWNDVGSWSAVWQQSPRDAAGNAAVGDVVQLDSENTLVHATHRLVTTLGVSGVMVVETPDAVLVADRSRAADVRALVELLTTAGRGEALRHRRIMRPWGSYETVDSGGRYQVKRIRVKPGGTLSLQVHKRRAEHWVVVRGRAQVTRGERVFELQADQSTYISAGERHRLHNPMSDWLELVEVQVGDYLGEDDIHRFEDVYGRAER